MPSIKKITAWAIIVGVPMAFCAILMIDAVIVWERAKAEGLAGAATVTTPSAGQPAPAECRCPAGKCQCQLCSVDCMDWRPPTRDEHPPAVINDVKARHALWAWRTNASGDWVYICTGGPHGNWRVPSAHQAALATSMVTAQYEGRTHVQAFEVFTNADGEWLFLNANFPTRD